jgi:nucleoside-diphosphate-sugar epimerase
MEGEEIVTSSGLDYVILRPSMMYGPTDNKNIGYLINFSRKSPFFPIPGKGNWPRQPLYVDDVCKVVLNLIGAQDFGHLVIPINGKETIEFSQMVKIVQRNTGRFRFRVHLPVPLFKICMVAFQKVTGEQRFTVDQVDSLTSNDVFEEYPWWDLFGVPVTPFEAGVRQMVEGGKPS